METEPEQPALLNNELVHSFVGIAHSDLVKVKAMLADEPHLLHAAHDWGGGDFETALGAASHMGRSDIARFLLGQGARLDLFAAAMLGELEVVRATLTAFPESLQVRGPHGIGLLQHAKAGGAAAATVVTYLKSLSP